jgi:cleavage and polyadenylation specificity factor subunit 1
MDGIIDMWTVKCSNVESEYHSYLVLSKENSTMVLQTGQELTQVKDAEFYTEGPTVVADSVLNDTVIVQIEPNKIILLNIEGKRIKEKVVGDDDMWIVSASILDPYMQILTNSGKLFVFKVTTQNEIEEIFEYQVCTISNNFIRKVSYPPAPYIRALGMIILKHYAT